MSPDFAMGCLIGITLMRVLYWWCGGYKEQDAYADGERAGRSEGKEEGHWLGYRAGYRKARQEIKSKLSQCL